MTKVLKDWGLQSWVDEKGVKCRDFRFICAQLGEEVGTLPFGHAEYPGKIDAEFYFLMYDDLNTLLRELTAEEGVEIRFNTQVTDIDPDSGTVLLDGGETLKADVIIGADGMSSMTRTVVNDTGFDVEETGQGEASEILAVGCTIPAEEIHRDPALNALLRPGEITYWLGDQYYIAASYSSPHHLYLNLWTSLPNTDAPLLDGWYGTTDLSTGQVQLRCLETGAEPRLQRLLRMVRNLTPIQYVTRARFENAVDESATTCLVGDAGHPTMPYSIHSIALGFEDASTLLHLFSGITHPTHIPRLLAAYEEIRQPRWDSILHAETFLRTELSMPPGPQRDERNVFISGFKQIIKTESDNGEDDMQTMVVYNETISLYDYDVTEAVDDWYSKWEALLNRPTATSSTAPLWTEGHHPTSSVTVLVA